MKSEIDSAHAGADIHFGSLAGGTCRGARRHNRPGRALEQTQQFHEPRPVAPMMDWSES
jgi:hypothetical protein